MKRTLCIAALCVAPLAGCQAIENLFTQSLSPELQSTLDSYDESLQDWSQAIAKAEQDIEELAKQAKTQAEEVDWAGAQITLGQLAARQDQHKLLTEQYTRIAQQERELLENHIGTATGGVLAILDPLVPIPLQPLTPFASTLLVMLLSRRGRKHAKNALRHTLVGNLGETAKDLLKAAGAKHTEDQPEQPEA